MHLVLLGLPGAGKGTQGERIAEKYRIPHISTGSIIRSVIASQSPLGIEVNGYISKGNLIPDELAIDMVRERLSAPDCRCGWILDGYPRTVSQAEDLDSALAKVGMAVDAAFDIRIKEQEAIRRIEKRRMCSQCGTAYHLTYYRTRVEGICNSCGGELYQRADDNEQTALQRLKVYMGQTHPVLHYYALQGRLFSVDGERPIGGVFQDVDAVLSEMVGQHAAGDSG